MAGISELAKFSKKTQSPVHTYQIYLLQQNLELEAFYLSLVQTVKCEL